MGTLCPRLKQQLTALKIPTGPPHTMPSTIRCPLALCASSWCTGSVSFFCQREWNRWPLPVFSLRTTSRRMKNTGLPRQERELPMHDRAIYRIPSSLVGVACCAVLPGDSTLYGISVRRPASLPSASFRPHLTVRSLPTSLFW